MGVWEKPDLIWSDAYNDRYGVYDAQSTWADKRFFYIYLKDKKWFILLCSYLNSSLIPLTIEIDGITNLGEGAVYTNVYQLERLGIPIGEIKKQERLAVILSRLKERKILSIFDELGANSPSEVSLDKVKPDRRELDKLIMGEILGLTDEEQLEVYRAVIDLVKSRLEKAKSFGKRKKTKEGIDIDLLVKIITEKIGEETLGKFYQENVLSEEALYIKSLPEAGGDISIQQSLLGWRLYSGKQSIDCASELEARYLKVWLEVGIDQVKVPRDESYLQAIVPQLESVKQRIDEVIEPYLNSIVNVKTRYRILRQLWLQMTKGV